MVKVLRIMSLRLSRLRISRLLAVSFPPHPMAIAKGRKMANVFYYRENSHPQSIQGGYWKGIR